MDQTDENTPNPRRPCVFALPNGQVAVELAHDELTAWLLVDHRGGTSLALGALSEEAVELYPSPINR